MLIITRDNQIINLDNVSVIKKKMTLDRKINIEAMLPSGGMLPVGTFNSIETADKEICGIAEGYERGNNIYVIQQEPKTHTNEQIKKPISNNESGELRIIIAGSRSFDDYNLLEETVDAVLQLQDYKNYSSKRVICGCAKGADELGKEYAEKHYIPVTKMPADWKQNGKGAGYRRNEDMAEFAANGSLGVLIAFWDGTSKGTQHMIDYARKMKLMTHVFNFDKNDVKEDENQMSIEE